MMRGEEMITGGSSSSSSSSSRCQDCGNQAKKECSFMRCRACCKSKGFQCQTHVKSTWIPAHRRRHRQQQLPLPPSLPPPPHLQNPKRFRYLNSSLSSPDANFPAEVNAMAEFRCLRVSSTYNGVDENAYETSVNIGGHVFKGILYDQGPLNCSVNYSVESSSAVLGGAVVGRGGAATSSSISAAYVEPLLLPHPLPTPLLNTLLCNAQFFPHSKS